YRMKRIRSLSLRAFPVLLFLLAVVPRADRPVSRPLVWYLRSAHFVEAMLARDFGNTIYSEHPGVGLMWPVGIALKLYWSISGIVPAAHAVPPDFEPIHFSGPVPPSELSAALFPLALLIALGVVAAYFMLRRLFDDATATIAGILVAISPYHLAESKVLHLDAWLSTLMLLSALAILIYRRERQVHWLYLSGALGGLAALTKTPALFLVPFCGLVLLVDAVRHGADKKERAVRALVRRLFLPLLLWLLTLIVVYVALFPVLWVDPAKGLGAVKWGLTRHATTAHPRSSFFLGRIITEDPGPLIYAVTLLFRLSEVTLVFLAAGALVGATAISRRRRLSTTALDTVLLVAYVFFFLIEVSLPEKKMARYVLPTIPVLDILAAMGLAAWARKLAGHDHRVAVMVMTLPVLIQAALVLPRHPYYGTALNHIAGGSQAAARAILLGSEAEGFAELAAYLNAQPNAEQISVAARPKHVFNQTFTGMTADIGERPADYVAFHRNYTVRDYKFEKWGAIWERYAARTPERRIDFDGVPYAWLYPALPASARPEHAHLVDVGERFRYLGHDLRGTEVSPGDRLPVVLYWQATQPVADDLSIFVHLLDPAGQLVWQDDGAANHGDRPTWSWAPRQTVADPHTVVLPLDLPPGDYVLTTGLYDWRTGERLPVTDPSGQAKTHDRIEITTLSVRHPSIPLDVWISRALASLILVSALVVAYRHRLGPDTGG
ncbi:MAG: glycosyltransferase family 39 protein, partial [Anaerolineae bacterium]